MDVLESTELVDLGVVLEKELMECRKKCADLELQMKQKNGELECLERKYKDVVVENLAIKTEFRVLKNKYDELEKRIPFLGNDGVGKEDVEDNVLRLMVENEVLACEKKKAESDIEVWKAKFDALESHVKEMEGRDKECKLVGKVKSEIGVSDIRIKEMSEVDGLIDGSLGLTHCGVKNSGETMHDVSGKTSTPQHSVEGTKNCHVSGDTDSTETPHKHWMHDESLKQGSLSGTKTFYGSQVRKQLTYGEGSPSKKMAPSTPAGVKRPPVGVIDISDSDGEHELTMLNTSTLENQSHKADSTDLLEGNSSVEKCVTEKKIEEAFLDQSDNEDIVTVKGSSLLNVTRKRRRVSNIVNSDSENEDVLNSDLKIDPLPELPTDFQSNSSPVHVSNVHKPASKRRLVTLGSAVSTPKAKGESTIVKSDTGSEDDDDDNVPISKLVTNSGSGPPPVSENRVLESVSRRRLASLRNIKENSLQKSSNTMSTMNTVEKNFGISRDNDDGGEDNGIEENESDSEGESLGGFIVDGSDISDGGNSSSIKADSGNSLSKNSNHSEASGDSENASDDDLNYGEIISKFRRSRENHTSKWEFEAEMLADFGKDPELCMKAVCALYRQQTAEEQSSKETIYRNNRGFSHCDAYRGTSLAEYLTNGDPGGDLQRSVDELKMYSSKGIELCRKLANRYSKQLFAIYKNKEDPFFLPDKVHD